MDDVVRRLEALGSGVTVVGEEVFLLPLQELLQKAHIEALGIDPVKFPDGSIIANDCADDHVDEFVKLIADCERVASVRLPRECTTDDHLLTLRGHRGIRQLMLSCDSERKITARGLAALPTLPNLEEFQPWTGNDAALAVIAGCQKLRILELGGWELTDDGMAPLSRLRRLEWLSLMAVPIKWGVIHLEGLPLRKLSLTDTNVDDTAMKSIGKIKSLRILSLMKTQVTDVGLRQLTGLEQLEKLYLDGLPITAGGLEHVAALPNVSRLDLGDVPITDAMIEVLCRMPQLRELTVGEAMVTDAQYQRLLAGLHRDCTVERW